MLIAAALMVIGLVLVGGPGARGWGAAGLVPVGLALAADRSVPGTAAPAEFLAVNAGLQLAGTALVALELLRAARAPRHPLTLPGVLAGAAGVAGALLGIGRTVLATGPLRALAIAALTTVVVAALRELASRSRALAAMRRRARARPALSPRPLPLIALALGAVAIALGPHIGIVLAGAGLSAWAAWVSVPPSDRPMPIAPALELLLVAAAGWLLAAIAGPEGLTFAAIPAIPLSPAAEVVIAPLLLGAAWSLGGLWPLRQPLGGVLTAPLGALLVIRLALPAVPAGLEHWRAAAFPVVLVGLWHAAVTARHSTLAVGGAFLGLASAQAIGIAGAGWLLACAVALELLGRVREPSSPGVTRALAAAIALGAGWGALLVLEAGLRTETVYSVLGALAPLVAVSPRRVDPS